MGATVPGRHLGAPSPGLLPASGSLRDRLGWRVSSGAIVAPGLPSGQERPAGACPSLGAPGLVASPRPGAVVVVETNASRTSRFPRGNSPGSCLPRVLASVCAPSRSPGPWRDVGRSHFAGDAGGHGQHPGEPALAPPGLALGKVPAGTREFRPRGHLERFGAPRRPWLNLPGRGVCGDAFVPRQDGVMWLRQGRRGLVSARRWARRA